jgi:hypothetical protein
MLASYLFITTDKPSNNGNVNKQVNFADIEGVWTYMYFSYSADQKRAVAFVKYADGQPIRVPFDVTHPETNYLKFTLGGNDAGRYKPFNGQFTRIYYNDQPGTFIDTEE